MAVCPRCDLRYEEGKQYCRQCGARLAHTEMVRYCPSCKVEHEWGKKYCKTCGRTLIDKVVDEPPTRPPASIPTPSPAPVPVPSGPAPGTATSSEAGPKKRHVGKVIACAVVFALVAVAACGGFFLARDWDGIGGMRGLTDGLMARFREWLPLERAPEPADPPVRDGKEVAPKPPEPGIKKDPDKGGAVVPLPTPPPRERPSGPDALFKEGEAYFIGREVAQDQTRALKCFLAAAKQGHCDAAFRLGWMCEHGIAVRQDHAEAVYWYRKAAAQGHAEARTHLRRLQGGKGKE